MEGGDDDSGEVGVEVGGEDYVDGGGEDDGDGEVCGDKDGTHTSLYQPISIHTKPNQPIPTQPLATPY